MLEQGGKQAILACQGFAILETFNGGFFNSFVVECVGHTSEIRKLFSFPFYSPWGLTQFRMQSPGPRRSSKSCLKTTLQSNGGFATKPMPTISSSSITTKAT